MLVERVTFDSDRFELFFNFELTAAPFLGFRRPLELGSFDLAFGLLRSSSNIAISSAT